MRQQSHVRLAVWWYGSVHPNRIVIGRKRKRSGADRASSASSFACSVGLRSGQSDADCRMVPGSRMRQGLRSLHSARHLRDHVYTRKFVSLEDAQKVEALQEELHCLTHGHRHFMTHAALAARAESPPVPKPGWKMGGVRRDVRAVLTC